MLGWIHPYEPCAFSDNPAFKCTDFYHPNDEGGLAWNDPQIGIRWPELTGVYPGHAGAEGYTLSDGTALSLSEKDQKWPGIQKK